MGSLPHRAERRRQARTAGQADEAKLGKIVNDQHGHAMNSSFLGLRCCTTILAVASETERTVPCEAACLTLDLSKLVDAKADRQPEEPSWSHAYRCGTFSFAACKAKAALFDC